MNKLILTTAAVTLLASPAFAQSSTTKPMTTPQAMSPAATTTGANTPETNATGGILMSKTMREPVKFAKTDNAELMSSKLVGLDVYNNQNEKVGQIADLAIDNGKTVNGVVLSVGGFLGIGESYVLVDPASLAVSNADGSWKAYINTSKDTLKNAPKFTYNAANKKS